MNKNIETLFLINRIQILLEKLETFTVIKSIKNKSKFETHIKLNDRYSVILIDNNFEEYKGGIK